MVGKYEWRRITNYVWDTNFRTATQHGLAWHRLDVSDEDYMIYLKACPATHGLTSSYLLTSI